MKLLKNTAKFILLLFVLLQFFNPSKNLEQGAHLHGFLKDANPSEEIQLVLQGSCYNCHSNQTNYPWYNNIAPVSFFLANDISNGKEKLNFSGWQNYSKMEKKQLIEEIHLVIENNAMPMPAYALFHSESKISADKKEKLLEWAKRTKVIYELGPLPK